MADTDKPASPPPEYVPPSRMEAAELQKLFSADDAPAEPPAAPPAPKPAETPAAAPPPAEKSADETPTLLKIAKEKAALRAEKATVEPHLQMLKVFSPQEAQRLAQARASGDPVAALAALGFTHTQYTQKLLSTKPAEAPAEEAAPPAGDPEVKTLKERLAALETERENERLQVARKEAFGKMESVLKDNPKFKTITTLGDYAGVEKVLLNYWAENGSMPGATFEESITLAAELHEADLKKEAEKWSKVLTPAPASGQTAPPKAPESPRPASESPRTLTNASATAPAAVRTVPKTEAEILQAIIAGEDLSHLG